MVDRLEEERNSKGAGEERRGDDPNKNGKRGSIRANRQASGAQPAPPQPRPRLVRATVVPCRVCTSHPVDIQP